MLVLNMAGEKDNNKEDHTDITHIPNDRPIPSEYPEDRPIEIPMEEPSAPSISNPIQAPIKEPNKKPKIRVLNIA
jgi:hypothetical protein